MLTELPVVRVYQQIEIIPGVLYIHFSASSPSVTIEGVEKEAQDSLWRGFGGVPQP